MDNVFEVLLFLNLDDNACLVDKLSTIPLTAVALKPTSCHNLDQIPREQFRRQRWQLR